MTRQRVDAARAALIDAAGGAENIVTERDIQTRRATAQLADIDTLTDVRATARELNNELARAEAAAGRAFADTREDKPDAGIDLAAQVGVLRSEVEVLEAAGGRAPAGMYRVPESALQSLEEESMCAVIAIANSAQAIQPLQLGAGADKPAVLAALAAAAHHHQHRVLALPATEQAADYAAAHRYADTATPAAAGRDHLQSGRWSLPIGSLVIIDDANQLPAGQLRWLIDNATATNTKLLLITNDEDRDVARQPPDRVHTLTDVLTRHLPWAQHLTTAPQQQRPTAIEAVTAYLATSPAEASDAHRAQATELLARHTQLHTRYHQTHTRTDTNLHTNLHHDRNTDTGLDL